MCRVRPLSPGCLPVFYRSEFGSTDETVMSLVEHQQGGL